LCPISLGSTEIVSFHLELFYSGLPTEMLYNSRKNEEQIEVREFWLSFGAETFGFQFSIQLFKD
jgi:hypothetical protein